MTTTVPFTKMVGAGNDFLIIDTRRGVPAALGRHWKRFSRNWCDRHRGVGADGLLILEPSKVATVRMRVFNPDGSEAPMCGNGARCVARYLVRTPSRRAITIETIAGVLQATVSGDRVAMQLPDPTALTPQLLFQVQRRRVHAGFINTGVPHLVVPVASVDDVDVQQLGRVLRHHPTFSPAGTNVDFVQGDARVPNRLRVRTYERGVEGETRACGTGVAAAAVLYALTGSPARTRSVRVNGSVTSGQTTRHRFHVEVASHDVLTVSFTIRTGGESGGSITKLTLEGPAHHICDGTVPGY